MPPDLITLRMMFKRLFVLLAALVLPGLCLGENAPQYNLSYTTAQKPEFRLAALDGEGSSSPADSTPVRTADQLEFPHLDLPSSPDREGLMHDSKLFLLYQVGVVGVLYLMPESVSQWGDDQKNGNIFRKWDDNVNNLRKDHDDWAINYIGHPYFGSVYYVRARQRGYSRQNSLWYSTVMSTIYEYGIEALFEPVSIQDLIFTPVGGAVIGEYFMTARENIKRDIANRGYATTGESVGLFFTDPLGVINQKVDKLFGYKEASVDLMPLFNRARDDEHTMPALVGLQAHVSW